MRLLSQALFVTADPLPVRSTAALETIDVFIVPSAPAGTGACSVAALSGCR